MSVHSELAGISAAFQRAVDRGVSWYHTFAVRRAEAREFEEMLRGGMMARRAKALGQLFATNSAIDTQDPYQLVHFLAERRPRLPGEGPHVSEGRLVIERRHGRHRVPASSLR